MNPTKQMKNREILNHIEIQVENIYDPTSSKDVKRYAREYVRILMEELRHRIVK